MPIRIDIGHPLAIPLLGLGCGSALAGAMHPGIPLWAPLAFAALLALSACVKRRSLYLVSLFLFWGLWGIAVVDQRLYEAERADLVKFCDREEVTVEGVVAGRPGALPEGEWFELKVSAVIDEGVRTETWGKLLLTINSGRTSLNRGDLIRFKVLLRIPRQLGLPGEFDYPRHLALQGISATAWLKEAGQIVLMRPAQGFSLYRLIDIQARRCRERIRTILPDPAIGPVMAALITGGQQEIPAPLMSAYSRAGVSHILSISGFHLGVISYLLVQAMTWLLLRSQWLSLRLIPCRTALFVSLPVIVCYLLFTGAAPATVRSAVMLGAVALALWAEREDDLLNALLTAAFLLLLIDPAALFDLSFQFSFIALWGIIVLVPLFLAPFAQRLSGFSRTVAQLLAASTAASLATAVPALITFHQASFTGILANLVIVPLLGYGATVLGALAIPFLLWLPMLAKPLLLAGGLLVRCANAIVQFVAELPVVRSFSAGALDLAAVIALLALLSIAVSRRARIAGTVCITAMVLLGHGWPVPDAAGRIRLVFLSVGQAESTLIRFPDNRTMLIDGGGYLNDNGRDFGERYLVPALHALQVRRIDYLVLTHPHPDHLGGLPAVAEQFAVGEFWKGPWAGTGPEYRRLLNALQQQKVPVRTVMAGVRPLLTENLEVMVLSPVGRGLPLDEDDGGNEDSLVLRIVYRGFSVLFSGDTGLPVEEQLLKQGLLKKTTLLKVGHHGSRTATGEAFIGVIRPELAVISVGAGNRFGLPAPEVIRRLQKNGTRIVRTDQEGTIEVESDGKACTVRTGIGGS